MIERSGRFLGEVTEETERLIREIMREGDVEIEGELGGIFQAPPSYFRLQMGDLHCKW